MKGTRRRRRRLGLRPDQSGLIEAVGTESQPTLHIAAGGFDVCPGAELEANESGAKKLPTMSGTAYTGGLLRQRFSQYPIVVDLAQTRQASAMLPLLMSHDRTQIVGHASAEISAQRIKMSDGVISGVGEAAAEVVATSKNGFPWQLSIGAQPEKLEFVDKGESVKVNGRNWDGPLLVARGTKLVEVSFVAVGADTNTSASIAASLYSEERIMNFAQWLAALGLEEATLSPNQKTKLQAKYNAEIEAAAKLDENDLEADDPEEEGDGETKEGDPPKRIKAKAKTTRLGTDGSSSDGSIEVFRKNVAGDLRRVANIQALNTRYPGHEDIVATAIEAGWSSDKTELTLMRKDRPEAVQASSGGPGAMELEGEVITAALCLNLGMDTKIIADGITAARREQVMNRASGSEYRGFGLRDYGMTVIRAAGKSYSGSFTGTGMLGAMREAAREIRASGFTTLSLPYVFGTVANRSLLTGYNRPELQWRKLVGKRSVKDFRPAYEIRFQLGSGGIQKIGKTGQLEHVKFEDNQIAYRIETRGGIVAITREDWINDDLGALMQIPEMLGWLAATSVEEEVFKLLINPTTGTYYRTSGTNPNLQTGAATALGIDSLTTAKTLFMDKQINGRPISVSPKLLLVGTALEVDADKLMRDTTLIASALGSTSAAKLVTNQNPHVGSLTRITSPYLNNTALRDSNGTALTGQSATQWFLLADPAQLAAFFAAFLNGQENPTIETQDSSVSDFDVLGTSMRVYIDFGVAESNDIAIVKSAGA